MVGISGVGRARAGGGAGSARPMTGAGGFPAPAATPPATTAAAAAASPVALGAMLALQETAVETTQDRAARGHGKALLKLLAALQSEMLGEDGGGAVLDRLAAMATSAPVASDRRLREVVAAIGLRARVELARRGG